MLENLGFLCARVAGRSPNQTSFTKWVTLLAHVTVLDYLGRERFVLSASLGTVTFCLVASFSSVAERGGRMWLVVQGYILIVHNAKAREAPPSQSHSQHSMQEKSRRGRVWPNLRHVPTLVVGKMETLINNSKTTWNQKKRARQINLCYNIQYL